MKIMTCRSFSVVTSVDVDEVGDKNEVWHMDKVIGVGHVDEVGHVDKAGHVDNVDSVAHVDNMAQVGVEAVPEAEGKALIHNHYQVMGNQHGIGTSLTCAIPSSITGSLLFLVKGGFWLTLLIIPQLTILGYSFLMKRLILL